MNEPKFQYSIFPNGSRDEQFVLRADTIQELQAQKIELDNLLLGKYKADQEYTVSAPIAAPVPEDDLIVPCKQCKGKTVYREGFSKSTGKPWKAYFCDKPNSTCKPYFVK